MAFTSETATRNSMCDQWVDLLDIGAGGNGTLRITTAGDVVLSEHALNATAFGAAVAGVATHNAIGSDTCLATGTATKCKWYDKDNTLKYTGTVTGGGGGGEVDFTSTSFVIGITIDINASGTMTFPA